jgi:hypothetical protein
MKKRGQIALYILVAILVVALAISAYFLFKPKPKPKYPEEIQKINEDLSLCLGDLVKKAKDFALQRGGYIYLPEEKYSPYFSNVIEFMGEKIPFWLYYDGSYREQVLSIEEIEKQFEKFVKENFDVCDKIFDGYNVSYVKRVRGVDVKIRKSKIEAYVGLELRIRRGEVVYSIEEIKTSIDSNFGKLYENALKIYEEEKKKRFLENYTIDVISLYAPTTGFELQCLPLVFNKKEIEKNIKDGLDINLERIKFKGDYFYADEYTKYYLQDVDIDEGINVNVIYLKDHTSIKIYGDEIFEPVGNWPVNIFCYVPYHFVYDVNYPTIFILTQNDEALKFPVAVIVERNGIKEIIEENETVATKGICERKITNAKIHTYVENQKAECDLYFKCLDAECYLGKSSGYLEVKVPECINAEIYCKDYVGSAFVNTNYDFSLDLYLDKVYEKEIYVDIAQDESAIVLFEGPTKQAIIYPEQESISIAKGQYNVSVFVFKEKNVTILGEQEICYDVPSFLIFKTRKCEKIEKISVDKVVVGGGKKSIWLDPKEIRRIEIYAERFGIPKTLEEIQRNYELVLSSELEIKF